MSKLRDTSPLQIALVVAIAIVLFLVLKFVVGLVWKLLFYGVIIVVALVGAWFVVDRFLSKGKR